MDEKKAKPQAEPNVRDAISAFEQILEAIPNDRLALETLYDAYTQLGDKNTAVQYLIRLGQAVAEDGDTKATPDLVDKLQAHVAEFPAARKVLDRLEKLIQPKPGEPPLPRPDRARKKMVDVTAEMALAWNLLQAGEFTQEDYSNVVHDLTESSSKNVEVPITVLHVLHDRGFKALEKILQFLSSNTGLPLLPLESFEPQKDAYKLLPLDFVLHRGAIAFDLIGPDVMVAILNPYDTELREDVQKAIGKRCHFYLATAENYDRCLGIVKKALQAAAEA